MDAKQHSLSGFTLIELLITIAIIGILAAVLIPNLISARERGFDTTAQACAKAIATAQEIEMIDTNAHAAALADLDTEIVRVCEGGVDPITVDATAAYDSATGWTVTHSNGTGRTYSISVSGIQ